MHRILVDTQSIESDSPILSREAAAHLKVVRPKNGEEMELFDGKGMWRIFRYSGSSLQPVSAPNFSKMPPKMVLFSCITKGSRWEWTIQKATELGTTLIVPVISDRTIVRIDEKEKDSKLSRWEKIAQEAARQSDAKYLPQILKPVSFEESLSIVDETECFAGALLDSQPPPIAYEMARRQGAKPPAIYVGPEGDFTPAELEKLLEWAKPVTFGETILRAETAAIYGLSVIKAFLDANHFDCAVKS